MLRVQMYGVFLSFQKKCLVFLFLKVFTSGAYMESRNLPICSP